MGFLDIVATRFMASDEEVKAMTKKELNELFNKFPLALWLRSNFIESMITSFSDVARSGNRVADSRKPCLGSVAERALDTRRAKSSANTPTRYAKRCSIQS